MTAFILLLLIASFFCFGVHAPLQEGMILERVGKFLTKTLGRTISKPLFNCPPCMASVYGTAFGVVVYDFKLVVILFVVCLCGLNYIIINFFHD